MHPIITRIRQLYEPVSKMGPGVITMTTPEVAVAVGNFTGEVLGLTEVYNYMIEAGFHYEDIGELEFVWLLRKYED